MGPFQAMREKAQGLWQAHSLRRTSQAQAQVTVTWGAAALVVVAVGVLESQEVQVLGEETAVGMQGRKRKA